MKPIYQEDFEITSVYVDRNGRLRPSMILYFAQEAAGKHSTEMTLGYEALQKRRLFWAVTRHRVQVTRMPTLGETIHIETWPCPPPGWPTPGVWWPTTARDGSASAPSACGY